MLRYLLPIALVTLSTASCVQEVSPATGCTGEADCASGEVCVSGLCRLDTEIDPVLKACTVADEAAQCGVGSFCLGGVCTEAPSCSNSGDLCPVGLICNEGTGACIRAPECEDCCTAASCDDGRFCNGVEICDSESGECSPGVPPCGDAVCDEATRSCLCGDDEDCQAPEVCQDGICACTPACDDKHCGDDGCGGTCGTCGDDDVCEDGLCVCIPECDGKQCGSDGCDGICGTCADTDECVDGDCVCVPDCDGRECGDDGCGGSCGTCSGGDTCASNGTCGCIPQCSGRECGDDGCGGSCGTCDVGVCGGDGQCNCTPNCSGRQCGSDGCGGSCGTCAAFQACSGSGQCNYTGVVCDTLTSTSTISEYQSRTGTLSSSDVRYRWHDHPERYLDAWRLDAPRNASMLVEMSSTQFDPMVYLYRIADDGTCWRMGFNDNSGGQNSAMSVTITENGPHYLVATSGGTTARQTGSYSLSTKAELCGLPVQNKTTYDLCRPRVAANGCNTNSCIDWGNSGAFCCITPSCRSGYRTGNEIRVLVDNFCLGP